MYDAALKWSAARQSSLISAIYNKLNPPTVTKKASKGKINKK